MSLHDKLGTLNYDLGESSDPFKRVLRGYTAHGNRAFDVPYAQQIAMNFYQGGCTTGLILPEMFKHVISLYPWERYSIEHEVETEAYFYLFDALTDFTSSEVDKIEAIADLAVSCADTGPVLVHCQAGLNRSSLILARAMMKRYGFSAEHTIDAIRSVRSPACLCNPSFEKYVRSYTDLL